MDTENIEGLVITVAQAAKWLKISRGLAYAMAHSGTLPVIRCGRRLVVSKSALLRMVDQAGARANPADGSQWK